MKRSTLGVTLLLVLAVLVLASGLKDDKEDPDNFTKEPPTEIPEGILVDEIPDDADIIFVSIRYVFRDPAFLDENYTDSNIRMSQVALAFNISPSHFSTVFRKEFGITYRDYISKLRIKHAKQLLRTTNLKCSEISFRSGFKDSHYFSIVFKKKTGLTPLQFRTQAQDDNPAE